jgi:hypothetical protein
MCLLSRCGTGEKCNTNKFINQCCVGFYDKYKQQTPLTYTNKNHQNPQGEAQPAGKPQWTWLFT